jgi:hypothetical protein
MKRIKSAPANIAEMVNRKKPTLEKKPEKTILFITQKKQSTPITITKHQHQLVPLKNQKIIERTFNTIMIDYINDKQVINNNDEEALLLSILYYYFCEKVFTKNNLREFVLFIVQLCIKYIFTHSLHEFFINNKDIILNNVLLLGHIK